jgi:hypothetical protein
MRILHSALTAGAIPRISLSLRRAETLRRIAGTDVGLAMSGIRFTGKDVMGDVSDVRFAGNDVRIIEKDVRISVSDIRIAGNDVRIENSDIQITETETPFAVPVLQNTSADILYVQ